MDRAYQLETLLYPAYPIFPPETFIKTPLELWAIVEKTGEKVHCPHMYVKTEQKICLWKEGASRITSQWNPANFTCVFAVQAAWRWLACYEIWIKTGEWPIPEAE